LAAGGERRLISFRFPYLRLRLSFGGAETSIEADALVDTGFDGDIAVPPTYVPTGLLPDGFTRWGLADSSQVRTPSYVAWVSLENLGTYRVAVVASGDEVMVGRGLTNNFRLILTADCTPVFSVYAISEAIPAFR
jgi:predicted aspartyl protease